MSNHSGSYMLNHVLILLKKYSFFEQLDPQKIKEFSKEIVSIGWDHDCNNGEIFEEIGREIGFCYTCREIAEKFEDDYCEKCHKELWPNGSHRAC